MRVVLLSALTIAVTTSPAGRSFATPVRQLIIQAVPSAALSRTESHSASRVAPAAPAAPGAPRATLSTRIESLALRVVGSLEDGMPPEREVALAPSSRATRPGPFDLDPWRIWLLEGPDSMVSAAVRA